MHPTSGQSSEVVMQKSNFRSQKLCVVSTESVNIIASVVFQSQMGKESQMGNEYSAIESEVVRMVAPEVAF